MLLFCALLGIFAIGAPGVPGGTVMASLGLITGVLMFDDAGTALMLAIFALQDSFGTCLLYTSQAASTTSSPPAMICWALVPLRMVQARHSFLPSVRKEMRPSRS